MKNSPRRSSKQARKWDLNLQTRQKLGISQEKFASIFGTSRGNISHLEWGRRTGDSRINTVIANLFIRFNELETGARPATHSVETKLFLNEDYKRVLPQMESLEKDCRFKIKELKKKLAAMQEKARNAEHSIIVLKAAINDLKEEGPGSVDNPTSITGLEHLIQDNYYKLLTCWEPEQAKLHAKIEALAGEARALRRYRVKVMREHDPFGKNRGG